MVALIRLRHEHLNANLKAGEVLDTDPVWATVFDILSKRGGNATHDVAVSVRVKDMLDRRRDEWLRRVHNQKDHKRLLQVRRRCHGRFARAGHRKRLGNVHLP
jgi:hypothetical protein